MKRLVIAFLFLPVLLLGQITGPLPPVYQGPQSIPIFPGLYAHPNPSAGDAAYQKCMATGNTFACLPIKADAIGAEAQNRVSSIFGAFFDWLTNEHLYYLSPKGNCYGDCSMAIAFDNATDGGNNGGSTTSLTFNHTATGSNLIGFVALLGDAVTGADDISSVTWGGNACTLVKKLTSGFSSSSANFMYVYEIVGPPSGSQSIVITAGSSHFLLAGAATYTGALQSSQPDAFTSQQSASSSALTQTTSITTTTDNSWVFLMEHGYDANNPPAAGTGSTRRTYGVAFGNWGIFDSNSLITPAGSYSMTTTRGASTFIGINQIMVSFKPFTGGGFVAVNRRTLGPRVGSRSVY